MRTKYPPAAQQNGLCSFCLPTEILSHPDLSRLAQMVYGLITSMPDFKTNGTTVSNKYIADRLCSNERSICSCIRDLKKAGFITTAYANRNGTGWGQCRTITVHNDIIPKSACNIVTYGNSKGTNVPLSLPPVTSGASQQPRPAKGIQSKTVQLGTRRSLVEYWNNLPGPHPRHKNPTSKVYKDSWHKLHSFRKGAISTAFNLDKSWLAQHKISLKFYDRPFSKQELERGLTGLSNLYTDGYWPRDKKSLPRTLSALIHNHNKRSMLLLVMFKGGDLGLYKAPSISQQQIGPLEQIALNTVREYNRSRDPNEAQHAVAVVDRVRKWFQSLPKGSHAYVEGVKEVLERFRDYLNCSCSEERLRNKLTLRQLGPGSTYWEWFVAEEKRREMIYGEGSDT